MAEPRADALQVRLQRAIEEEVAEAERRIQRLVRSVLEADPSAPVDPFVYGWVLQLGPDGVPHFREFGPSAKRSATFEEVVREPLWASHIDGTTKAFRVRVELPGVDREGLTLRASAKWVRLEARAKKLRYQLKIPTPVRIQPDPIQLRFEEGVLEAHFRTTERFQSAAAKRRIHTGGDFR